MKLAHIINPVKVPPVSDLHLAQRVTFASMRNALAIAGDEIEVEVISTCFAEDEEIIPDFVRQLPRLDRSVLDVADIAGEKKLPLLADILSRGSEGTDATHLIYSNIDIALQPSFYGSVAALIERDHEAAFSINRRIISADYTAPDQIWSMYAELGKPHPGHDCFIFPCSLVERLRLGHICIGSYRVARQLMLNLLVHAARFDVLADLHLTFHLGDDRPWRQDSFIGYRRHNEGVFRQTLLAYQEEGLLPDDARISDWLGPYGQQDASRVPTAPSQAAPAGPLEISSGKLARPFRKCFDYLRRRHS